MEELDVREKWRLSERDLEQSNPVGAAAKLNVIHKMYSHMSTMPAPLSQIPYSVHLVYAFGHAPNSSFNNPTVFSVTEEEEGPMKK